MPTPHDSFSDPSIDREAAAWLARRDRGLSPAEQDAYVQWLAADPRHPAAVKRHAAAFERMMQLYEWQPGQSTEPNPDLFRPRRRSRWTIVPLGLAAAITLAIGGAITWRSAHVHDPAPVASYLRVNERMALPDGTLVELKDGSRLTTAFAPRERHVSLVGEGHFTVAKDPTRPFVVDAGGVAVRAVGTAFNVRVDSDTVEVLVTEGRVQVRPPTPATAPAAAAPAPAVPIVAAQQRAIVSRTTASAPRVEDVTPGQVAAALAWQAPRLQFFETPLAVAVAEFNQRNRTQLVILDPKLRRVPIGGTFRVDNLEGFLRALEVTCDVHAEPRGANEIVLSRTR